MILDKQIRQLPCCDNGCTVFCCRFVFDKTTKFIKTTRKEPTSTGIRKHTVPSGFHIEEMYVKLSSDLDVLTELSRVLVSKFIWPIYPVLIQSCDTHVHYVFHVYLIVFFDGEIFKAKTDFFIVLLQVSAEIKRYM